MATCGFMDVSNYDTLLLIKEKYSSHACFVIVHMQQAEMSTILFQLKGSPQVIEDVLENVSKVRNNYS